VIRKANIAILNSGQPFSQVAAAGMPPTCSAIRDLSLVAARTLAALPRRSVPTCCLETSCPFRNAFTGTAGGGRIVFNRSRVTIIRIFEGAGTPDQSGPGHFNRDGLVYRSRRKSN
jgi:hypothetical protein